MEITLGCGLWRLEQCCEVKWQREENELCSTCCCCSVTKSCPTLCNPWTTTCQASLSFTSPRACSDLCPLNWWCYLTISSSSAPFFFWLQSFPASGSFLLLAHKSEIINNAKLNRRFSRVQFIYVINDTCSKRD